MNYKEQLKKDEYKFLFENEHLGNNIIMLCLGGSHAYGTNTPTSDLDIRGIALERPNEIIGYQKFEQFQNEQTDTVIYGFNKMLHLLADANPNIIEILGLEEDQYLYISPLGRELLNNKHLFLSQKCFYTFGGYARANLKRLENAMARDNYPESKKNEHISISLQSAITDFNTKHKGAEVDPAFAHVTDDGKLVYDLHLTNYPAENLEDLYSTISNTTRNYRELLNRNRKKDDAHLNKHAMHLVRLYLMCLDMLTKGEIKTKRTEDHQLLMDIRNGKYMDSETGLMKPEFYSMIKEIEDKCNEALKTTSLPKRPDMKGIEEFVMRVNRGIVNGEYKFEENKFTL